jgi:ABC-type transporter Mla maintaining outer membrane lipid asymmetry ATPase subunit MlaF
MPVDFRVESLRFSGDPEVIDVADSDLVVFIGPNNAGKSVALRDIEASIEYCRDGQVLIEVTNRKEGDDETLLDWLSQVGSHIETSAGPTVIGPAGNQLSLNSATHLWFHTDGLRTLIQFFVHLVNAESRLRLVERVSNIGIRDGHAVLPLQRLLQNIDLEERLSRAVERAFGTPVSLSRAGGGDLQLLLGRATAEARVDNADYLDEIRAMPVVEEQGDGMRSFIGLLLTVIATPYKVVLIDEPEAFLHPPQARELGRQLAALGESQRFIATHDIDVLLGLLERGNAMTIIRLRREGNRNIPSVLNQERVKELWSDPSFRYSNLLDGLFHKGVVVCEADGDATLYAAALDAELEEAGEPTSDLLFTQCGGKHKMPTAIDALRPMGVPVAAILDIDVLREAPLLERIVTALGGDWGALRQDWEILAAAVEHMPTDAPTIESVKSQVENILGEDPTASLQEAQTRRIREITRSRDGWRRVREAGLSALPHGDATAAAQRLLHGLATTGAFIVQVGSLEGWAPEIGGHGVAFVDQALSAEVHRRPELRSFVTSAADFLLVEE